MKLTITFPKVGTRGRRREERAVEGAVLAYRAVVECLTAGKVPNVKTISEHAGVSATDRNPTKRVFFFHLGRELCVEAGLLTVTARGRSQVHSLVGETLTDEEVVARVTEVVTPEVVALPEISRK
ncbi:hypothetical protein [Rhodococcus rhodochrous]|uniref:hypothetical protein n=1 Tax=Rhodococcus rhodochrous TaxID=1829 RepID=UPI0011AE29DE|nr:hypothetical protein [Rhodococcus rhodochrous]